MVWKFLDDLGSFRCYQTRFIELTGTGKGCYWVATRNVSYQLNAASWQLSWLLFRKVILTVDIGRSGCLTEWEVLNHFRYLRLKWFRTLALPFYCGRFAEGVSDLWSSCLKMVCNLLFGLCEGLQSVDQFAKRSRYCPNQWDWLGELHECRGMRQLRERIAQVVNVLSL